MRDSFDAYEYIDAMRRRWHVIVVACAVAGILALVVSLLLPKRYTATASIMIEPPGSNDVRTATAVSPVYLESLKTYERFAESDTLFARAAERFHLLDAGRQSIESLKRRVLKVNKPRDTRILEISATLGDPKLAQQFVQFLSEETVTLSRNQNLASDRELIDEANKQLGQAQSRLDAARKARVESAGVEGLQADVEATTDLLAKMRQQLMSAEADAAEYQAREKSLSSEPADLAYVRQQVNAAKARAAVLEQRVSELARSVSEKSAELARRTARGEQADMELKTAQSAFEVASNRLRDMNAAAGMRAERLRLIDPGIVPQRPSSPNVFLNVMAALLVAFTASIVWLSLSFAVHRAKPAPLREAVSRSASLR